MVKLEDYKNYTQNKAIERMPVPLKVYLPLSQHLGRPCVPLVKIGDSVVTGQKIASVEAKVFAPVHSSISGKVTTIQEWAHPVLSRCQAIVVETQEQQYQNTQSAFAPLDLRRTRRSTKCEGREEVDKLTPQEIRDIVFNAGIVGMGGASFPTHIKLAPLKPVEVLIINGAECEPYLTGDYRLMLEKTSEILKGIELAVKCVGAKKVYIAIEDNKPKAIEAFKQASIEVVILNSNYPQGSEKQLIENILGKQVPRGRLPFDAGVSVQNVGTILAVYEAIYLNKPLYERAVTVTGSCVVNPKNVLAAIGAPIRELIDFCGGLKEEPAKIIIGGPMMGIAQYTGEAPVIKSTTGIILMNKQEALEQEELFCIRCGACVRVCPMNLMPTSINLASLKEKWQEAKLYGAGDCIECGSCSYVCPSNIRLVQSIRRAKFELMKQ